MSRKKTRLELTWIGKEERPKLEPRILLEDPEKSYHASVRRPGDIFDNMLIHGDNLLALKALEADFAGQVKCIYIDPPYNTGSAFEHYDDGIEHSLWLSLMRERLEILKGLLHPGGVFFASIDDNEAAYLKVLLDEVFGRRNFCGQLVWEKKRKPSFLNQNVGSVVEYVLAYTPNRDLSPPFVAGTVSEGESYPFYNAGNSRGDLIFPAKSVSFKGFADQTIKAQDMSKKTTRVKLKTDVKIKGGTNQNAFTLEGEWRYSQNKLDGFAKKGDEIVIKSMPFRPRWVNSDLSRAKKMHNLLSRAHYQMATYEDATAESIQLFGKDAAFDYPKPEKLISTLIAAVTQPGDLVMDSFAGSGTTGAVAHKMGRRWIMVELGDHAETLCQPRLKAVVDGDDLGGVSEEYNWQGGGGFRYYRLAPSLLQKDEYGNWIINKDYNAAMLAEALCKIEGFKYDPSPEVYWQQGRSTETDYIFVTTQTMTADMLQKLSDEVGPDRSLLVMCKAFRSKREWPNLTVKKIPKAVLAKCEWGHDDYSLEIKELPVVEDEPEATDGGTQVEPKTNGAVKKRRRKAAAVAGGNLFAGETDDGDQEGD